MRSKSILSAYYIRPLLQAALDLENKHMRYRRAIEQAFITRAQVRNAIANTYNLCLRAAWGADLADKIAGRLGRDAPLEVLSLSVLFRKKLGSLKAMLDSLLTRSRAGGPTGKSAMLFTNAWLATHGVFV